jgi:excinuclease ABC subunit C
MINLQRKLKNLPASPGVYIFRDKNGVIIYIGKATILRERVKSYFKDSLENRPVVFAIDQIADIEIKKTDSVLEALILEANLIKKNQPKYNVKEKDDKSFSYAVITKEEFPRVLVMRETELNKSVIASNAKQSRADNFKNGIATLQRTEARKDIVFFGPYTSKKNLETALKIMRKIFPFHSGKQKTEKGCLEHQIGLCPGPYAGEISREDYQKNIRGIKMILEGKKNGLIKKLEKEMQAYSKDQEFEKAGEMRNKIFALKHIQDVALISGEQSLSLPPHPNPLLRQEREKAEKTFRTEAYDISNISGKYATGSMVVFENNEPNKNEYRKFKIKTIQGANDVGMMKEVLLRRFQNDWTKPDLILLDGGVGHLNMGEAVLKGLGIKISIAAVAKGPTRKNLEIKSRNLDKRSQLFLENKNLLKQIMDEAHRFAIGYHRKLRRKIKAF